MTVTIRQKKQQSKTSYLYADISYNGRRVKYSLGITIQSGTFDTKRQIVKGRQNLELNNLLSHYKTVIFKVIREMQLEGIETTKELRGRLDSTFRNVDENKPTNLYLEFVEGHISRVSSSLKRRTILNYNSTVNKLKEYEKRSKKALTFEDINYQFYHSFVEYCRSNLELSRNTIGTHIKNVKAWMSVATEEGINTNLAYKGKGFKVLEEKIESIYLSIEEIEQIRKANLASENLDRVRDIFLVGCYTGLRIGDYHKINDENIIGNSSLLKVHTQKTGEEVVIPLHPFVKGVLRKYNGMLPMLSHQKFNKHIKKVGALANITDLVSVQRTKGNRIVKSTLPKHELISSHCARRSFATNAFKAGIPSISIMQITGHRTEKNFLKYIRVSKEENAILMAKNSFFTVS